MVHDTLESMRLELVNYTSDYPTRHRISKQTKQLRILTTLFEEIIFKPADKNLGLVAIHIEQYHELIMEHLANTLNYRLVSSSSLQEIPLLQSLNMKYQEFIRTSEWYRHEEPLIKHTYKFTLPKFHVLPKLHKAGQVKGRPIAGQVNWITTPISIILNHRLQEYLPAFPNILKNSNQLVNDLELFNASNYLTDNNLNINDIWIITGDIEALYPNIDIQKLIAIINSIDSSLTEMVDFICNNSYIHYFGKVYKQLNGIPMGTNAAVSLANIYVGQIIDEYIDSRPNTIYYRRYIDDLFILWKGDITLWHRAAYNINKLHPSIKIVFEPPSKTTTNFLDVSIHKSPTLAKFTTTVFQKPLNKYNYITPSSCHAEHMFSGFIKGELTRYARLSSSIFSYKITKQLFYKRLIQRGYKRTFINPIFKKHRWSIRFSEPHRNAKTILPLVIPYTMRDNASKINKIVNTYRPILSEYLDYGDTLTVYSKRRNIADILCPSSYTPNQCKLLRDKNYKLQRNPGT
jgi:hypothetical protein